MDTGTPRQVPPRAVDASTRRLPAAVRAFLHTESAGGIVLLAGAVAALVWANSPWHESYETLWHTEVRLAVGDNAIADDLRHWVNDGLMALFFLVVGLEVKREMVTGELRRWKTAALPTIAAVGGMVVPAVLYAATNAGGEGIDGWGIPMATDIAFALGVLAVLGRRVHPGLKLFLLTLAVADDIGAIVVIAIFYTSDLEPVWLLVAVALLAVVVAMQRAGVVSFGPFLVVGAGVWLATYNSGVHATIAGVALGLLARAQPAAPEEVARGWAVDLAEEPNMGHLHEIQRAAKTGQSTVERLERGLHPWTSFLIVPVFALANAGVRVADADLGAPGAGAVVAGIVVGLVAGKFLGVLAAAWLAVRSGVGELPAGLRWTDVAGGAACAGIGFTVSLFIAGLAFEDPVLVDAAKVGILVASFVAAALGVLLLTLPGRQRRSGSSAST